MLEVVIKVNRAISKPYIKLDYQGKCILILPEKTNIKELLHEIIHIRQFELYGRNCYVMDLVKLEREAMEGSKKLIKLLDSFLTRGQPPLPEGERLVGETRKPGVSGA